MESPSKVALREMRVQKRDLMRQLVSERKRIKTLERETVSLRTQTSVPETYLVALNSEKEDMARDLSTERHRVAALEKEVAYFRAQHQRTSSSLETERTRAAALRDELKLTKDAQVRDYAKLKAAKTSVSALTLEKDKLLRLLTAERERNLALKSDADKFRAQINTLTQLLNQEKSDSHALKKSTSRLLEQEVKNVAFVQTSLDRMRQKVAAGRVQLASLASSNNALSAQKGYLDRSLIRERNRVETLERDVAADRAREIDLTRLLETEQKLVASLRQDLNAASTRLFKLNTIQNEWNTEGCSKEVLFTSGNSFLMLSVDDSPDGTSMPGVYGNLAMDSGVYLQQLSYNGTGYTFVGLVANDTEKENLKFAGNDFRTLPLMKVVSGNSASILVDMNKRVATMTSNGGGETSFNLPAKVWVACALKRSTAREATLLPCLHWDA
ncbi:hypothetical protein MPSEU_000032100 [Mayamaea pseudoterrestris]|nr:hypothetical protein MPSEU_000032100 [Mayamaea pseudoterrestris]